MEPLPAAPPPRVAPRGAVRHRALEAGKQLAKSSVYDSVSECVFVADYVRGYREAHPFASLRHVIGETVKAAPRAAGERFVKMGAGSCLTLAESLSCKLNEMFGIPAVPILGKGCGEKEYNHGAVVIEDEAKSPLILDPSYGPGVTSQRQGTWYSTRSGKRKVRVSVKDTTYRLAVPNGDGANAAWYYALQTLLTNPHAATAVVRYGESGERVATLRVRKKQRLVVLEVETPRRYVHKEWSWAHIAAGKPWASNRDLNMFTHLGEGHRAPSADYLRDQVKSVIEAWPMLQRIGREMRNNTRRYRFRKRWNAFTRFFQSFIH